MLRPNTSGLQLVHSLPTVQPSGDTASFVYSEKYLLMLVRVHANRVFTQNLVCCCAMRSMLHQT